ncbi:MAG: GNAT family N-acetyltransferase [Anaerolineales bacterium]|nr:GNAT family N-acetyltransferase [Anaerolineales bacterium]
MEDGPIISGRRVKLGPVRLADLPFFKALWNDGRVMRHLGFPGGLGISRENMFEWWQKNDTLNTTHLVIKNELGYPIGECGWGFGSDRGILEFKLARAFWGRGYAREALEALLDYIWNHTAIKRVYCTPLCDNQVVGSLLEHFSFKKVLPLDGLGCDRDCWSLERPIPSSLPETLVFDWGGVLMRTEDDRRRRSWEAELGLATGGVDAAVFESYAWNQAQLGCWSVECCWDEIGNTLGLEPDRLVRFRQDFWAGDRLDRALVGRIREWKESGYRIALLSNHSLELEARLDENGVRPLFDPIVISAHEGIMKPGAKIYWRICRQLGISPVQALFVDDSIQNIRGAQYVGMHAVHFRATQPAISEIEAVLS